MLHVEYVTGQLAMHTLRERYGISPIPFSEMLASPSRSQRALRMLIRGAGGTSPSLGLEFVPARAEPEKESSPLPPRDEWVSAGPRPLVDDSPPPDSTWRPGESGWYSPREGQPFRVERSWRSTSRAGRLGGTYA